MLPSGKKNPAVFLDRDGVVNKSKVINGLPFAPRSLDELEIQDGVTEAVSLLKKENFKIIIVTNQPDISNGYLSQEMLSEINRVISNETGINHFYICIHTESDNCDCRKPRTGMLIKASEELDIDLAQSFLVGDRWKDIKAGQLAGCKCFFIDHNYAEQQPEPPFVLVKSVLEAAKNILEKKYEL